MLATLLLFAGAASAHAQNLVIPPVDYTPPETVQRVAIPLSPNERLRLLIVTGENSYEHDWTGVNNLLRRQLQESGRFDVRVIEDFRSATPATLAPYNVVLLNYLGRWNYTDPEEKRWGAGPEQALFDYVRNGGGIVVYHASFNMGSPSWPAFERMAGGAMRPFHGSRRSPPNAFMVRVVDREHPVTRGMREYFWTLNDDLYANMKWDPEARVRILATARDASASYAPQLAGPKYPPDRYTPRQLRRMAGMDGDHPQVWTVEYGRGRVFCISLGHGPDTLQYDGVRGLIARGAEWAASGAVTIPVESGAQAFASEAAR
ncbi:MAG: ThuA domain-containing protein [Hyphomonadaceae bacterium]|nr:ThuA domain-containing protein [Hyphomonadaceae bacterium]